MKGWMIFIGIVLLFLMFGFIGLRSWFVVPGKFIDKEVSDQYKISGNEVLFTSMNNAFELGTQKIEEADAKSFEVIDYYHAKDSNRVYFNQNEIRGADPDTFEEIEDSFIYQDKNAIYLYDVKLSVDKSSFEYLYGRYYKDKNGVYYSEDKIFSGSNIKYRKLEGDINEEYIIVNELLYNGKNQVEIEDIKTSKIISKKVIEDGKEVLIKVLVDSKNVYPSLDEKIPFENIDSLVLLSKSYQRDKNNIYYNFQKINGSDVNTFELLKHGYAKDKNKIYIDGKFIVGESPEEFNFEEFYSKSKDYKNTQIRYSDGSLKFVNKDEIPIMGEGKLRRYSIYDGKIFYSYIEIFGSDLDTFKVLGDEDGPGLYSKDNNYVYYNGKKLEGADPKSFELIEPDNSYSKDNNYVYYNGKKLEGADPKSFVSLFVRPEGNIYGKDKNNAYFLDKQIKGTDLGTFKLVEEDVSLDYSKDKNSIYNHGRRITNLKVSDFRYSYEEYNSEKIRFEKIDEDTVNLIKRYD